MFDCVSDKRRARYANIRKHDLSYTTSNYYGQPLYNPFSVNMRLTIRPRTGSHPFPFKVIGQHEQRTELQFSRDRTVTRKPWDRLVGKS